MRDFWLDLLILLLLLLLVIFSVVDDNRIVELEKQVHAMQQATD